MEFILWGGARVV